jgi:hypothetical protein
MGARRISNATNEKIIALMSMGKTGEQAAFAVRHRRATPKAAEAAPQPEPPAEPIDNTAAAIIELLEKLDEAVNTITEAADDICQTISTARKLNEDCINATFDVLTATLRDGVESVKTTIRKGRN